MLGWPFKKLDGFTNYYNFISYLKTVWPFWTAAVKSVWWNWNLKVWVWGGGRLITGGATSSCRGGIETSRSFGYSWADLGGPCEALCLGAEGPLLGNGLWMPPLKRFCFGRKSGSCFCFCLKNCGRNDWGPLWPKIDPFLCSCCLTGLTSTSWTSKSSSSSSYSFGIWLWVFWLWVFWLWVFWFWVFWFWFVLKACGWELPKNPLVKSSSSSLWLAISGKTLLNPGNPWLFLFGLSNCTGKKIKIMQHSLKYRRPLVF